jgi:response regulator RpfG family c-di-GMP phosphodiesterase
MTDITPVVVGGIIALAGVLVTSGVQLFVNSRAHRQQMERDTVAYTRQVTDAKRERLIRRYEEASRIAETYSSLSRRVVYASEEQTESFGEDFHRALNELQEVKVYLALEDDTADVIRLCNQLELEYIKHEIGVMRGDTQSDVMYEALDKTVAALRAALQAHLKALANPR